MIKRSNYVKAVFASLLALMVSSTVVAQEARSLEELLELVKNDGILQSQDEQDRIARFIADRNNQQRLLNEARQEREREERRSEQLKQDFDANEIDIAEKQQQLTDRLGTLTELFGHLTAAAGDTRGDIELSITSAQYPGRTEFLDGMIDKMSSTTELPSIDDIKRLWSEMMFEMIETGKVVKFTAEVRTPDGESQQREVVRVGNFNLVSDGDYLNYEPSTKSIEVLPRQPSGKFTGYASDLQGITDGYTQMGLDPSGPKGGGLLAALIDLPSLKEKWGEGKQVGLLISILGGVAALIAIWRLIVLVGLSGSVSKQLKRSEISTKNPLGRVLNVYEQNKGVDLETLELKLNEAILKERPPIVAWLNALKIIAAVAPLLGLLGTVTGMIGTFQGIMIFGAGDVQGMAGGISQALVTTVLGLLVAIPTVLLHSLVNSRATRIIHILEEQAAGIVAERSEGQ